MYRGRSIVVNTLSPLAVASDPPAAFDSPVATNVEASAEPWTLSVAPPHVPVAVNVSPLQLLDPRFPNLVAQTLQNCGISAQWLTLEITESSAVQNLEQTTLQIEQLRTMGVHVAMDDFGTGFSSLNMLRSLRLHTVKIDRGLIDPLPSADAIAVVRAICQLAEALHLHVVAEGVETASQAGAARAAGCGELQGYLYSKPLVPSEVGPWLERLATRYSDEDMESATESVKLGE